MIAIVLYIRFKTDSKLKDVKYVIICKKKKVRTNNVSKTAIALGG